ncbi:MAG: peptidoglycan-N-acetylglucosamine deacetylase [Solirubrobacteraceae bacterium]|nr:peptidoglycan-N-acetylglucosamine deacetylase [Solirubrobacteraceae bacterium]
MTNEDGPAPSSHPHLRREAAPEDWRDGAAAVVALTFDVDAETAVLAEGEHYAGDLSTMSHQAYGPRVGVPRLLALLARHGLPATFFVPGETAQRWPATVAAILDRGHEVALHGHTHRRLTLMSEAEQREDLERGLAALAACGVTPRGYRAPYWQLTGTTLELLPAHGIVYDASLMDDDRPYRLVTPSGTLAELPVHWSLDDWEQYAFLPDPDIGQLIETPSKVVELWTGELDAMRETGSLCVITCHPFISGRPSRIRGIERFVEFALACGDVRFSGAGALADSILGDVAPAEAAP